MLFGEATQGNDFEQEADLVTVSLSVDWLLVGLCSLPIALQLQLKVSAYQKLALRMLSEAHHDTYNASLGEL